MNSGFASRWTVATCVLGVAMICELACADCGSIPFWSPVQTARQTTLEERLDGGKDVKFDPLKVVVYEPGQRGIILWNGARETLLLSTEIRVSGAASLLEVIPFPSEPTAQLGDFEMFQKMQRLLIEKTMWRVASGGAKGLSAAVPEDAARITFSEKMGAHDISVVRVDRPEYFLEWTMNFMREKQAVNPQVDPKFVDIIEDYLSRNFQWFVFDTIDASDSLKSKEPIEYQFATDSVYYPLQISSLEKGRTMVDLLLVTPQPVSTYEKLEFAVKRDKGVDLTHQELAGVSGPWAQFMGPGGHSMQRVYIRGRLGDMRRDFIVR